MTKIDNEICSYCGREYKYSPMQPVQCALYGWKPEILPPNDYKLFMFCSKDCECKYNERERINDIINRFRDKIFDKLKSWEDIDIIEKFMNSLD